MPRLFYKDMKAHEKAYRNDRAEEAKNDIILGSKVNVYTGLEEAKAQAIDEIATNYSNFLKALETKTIPLVNSANAQEKKLESKVISNAQNAQNASNTSGNILMPKQKSVSENTKIQDAIQYAEGSRNYRQMMKVVNDILKDDNKLYDKFNKYIDDNSINRSRIKKNKMIEILNAIA